MPDSNTPAREHHANLGTGNGLVQFVCCGQTEHPFDVLWVAPGGKRPVNVYYTPRQSYDMVVQHLTRGQYDDATLNPILEAAEQLITQVEFFDLWQRSEDDVRASIEHIAEQLDAVNLTVRD